MPTSRPPQTDRTFPIRRQMRDVIELRRLGCPDDVPWALVVEYGARARMNHGMSLGQLANHGGLNPRAMAALLQDQLPEHYQALSLQSAVVIIRAKLAGLDPGKPSWAK